MRVVTIGLLLVASVLLSVLPQVSASAVADQWVKRIPNELGEIPILEYHVLGAKEGDFSRTREHFRSDLLTLWNDGFVTVPLNALLDKKVNVPKGRSPVVLTFDDSSKSQFTMVKKNGQWVVDPNCAVGILVDFAAKHPGFGSHATFYINSYPFAQSGREVDKLKYLIHHGMDVGNHTYNHVPLRQLAVTQIQTELGRLNSLVKQWLPTYKIRSVAYPLGSVPHSIQIVTAGSWNSVSYHNEAGLLVGSNPAPSPYTKNWDPMYLPRIQAGDQPFQATYWLKILRQHPERLYISDGNMKVVTRPPTK